LLDERKKWPIRAARHFSNAVLTAGTLLSSLDYSATNDPCHEQYSRGFPGSGCVFHALLRRGPVALATEVNVKEAFDKTPTPPPG
jgi:hypothetical protein